MMASTFLNLLAKGQHDIVRALLDLLDEAKAPYCIIGGLAVNAYADPVVSLDLDLVVVADRLDDLCERARAEGMKVEAFPHSVNLAMQGSDLRIQFQTDPRYQAFLDRAQPHTVLGYPMVVAHVEDVLQGKLWAWQDASRRRSKRQKDLADILRMVESHPVLEGRLPEDVMDMLS